MQSCLIRTTYLQMSGHERGPISGTRLKTLRRKDGDRPARVFFPQAPRCMCDILRSVEKTRRNTVEQRHRSSSP